MSPRVNRFVALACAALVAAGAAAPATAQMSGARQTVAAGSGPQLINLPRGTSFAVDLPADARDVIVSNPAVAEANVHSPRRITVITHVCWHPAVLRPQHRWEKADGGVDSGVYNPEAA